MDEDTFPDGTRRCCDSYPGTEHDEHCPTPHWPSGDATPERFSLVVNEDKSVTVLDGETPIRTYVGANALADALQRRMVLAQREAAGLADVTPEGFLTETLPAYARTQRLGSMLTEVQAAESSLLADLTEAIVLLNQAVSLRERLEKALEAASRPLNATEKPERAARAGRCSAQTSEAFTGAAVRCALAVGHVEAHRWIYGEPSSRPLSATEKPERAAGVRQDNPYFGRLRGEAAKLHLVVEDSNPGSALSKPQPY